MDFQYIHDKIFFLIEENNTNPHRLSLELSYSGNYLNAILNKHKDIKMSLFLNLCEKLHVTPAEFFTKEQDLPYQEEFKELQSLSKDLTEKDMEELISLAKKSAYYNQNQTKPAAKRFAR